MEQKYQLDTKENKALLNEFRNTLFQFGHHFSSPDGSAYYLDNEGNPWIERDRETYMTGRMAHVYSIGTLLGHEGSEALADTALQGLRKSLRDTVHGGWYSGLTKDNLPTPNKLCYAHAFVILAASSCMAANRPGASELLKDALAEYDRYFWNEEEGLARDLWNIDFTKLDDYRGLNSNMHTVEAFLAVADITGSETYRIRCGRIIDHVIEWASNNNWRIPEHFSKEWVADLEYSKETPDDPFKPYGATPGHGLEWARLITQWALSTYKSTPSDASYYIDAAENLYVRAISDGWYADGAPGIVYTTDWSGIPVVHDRMHWTLMEAINTAAVLAHVTKKIRYAEDYAAFMQYWDTYVWDHVHGSCFHQMDRNNHVIGTVWPGKNDIYHALQATLIPYHSPELSLALAIKNTRTL